MKKLTLLIVLLVTVSVVSFAVEVKPAFTLAGSASVAWGINLDAKTQASPTPEARP